MDKKTLGNIRLGLITLSLGWLSLATQCTAGEFPVYSVNDQQKAAAKEYCIKNGLDTNHCILIDMSIHSGKNRLFLVNFHATENVLSGICSHGSCNGSSGPGYSKKGVVFSNKHGSYCSSIGKYKIGKRSYSNFGINIHYKLHGLEPTNSNAFKRVVVLHSYWAVPNQEIFPDLAPTSFGCPMVSDANMRLLDKFLVNRKNVLLWIYN
jgi:hypothetical protein